LVEYRDEFFIFINVQTAVYTLVNGVITRQKQQISKRYWSPKWHHLQGHEVKGQGRKVT